MPLNPSHHYQISFPALSDYGISSIVPRFIGLRNIKFHSPLYRIMEYQNHRSPVYRIMESQKKKTSFPGCRITEVHSSSIFLTVLSPSISQYVTQIQSSQKNCHLPFCRITKCQKVSSLSVSHQGLSLNTIVDNHLPQ